MKYTKVESYSTTRPLEVDTESSKTAVYLRKDIEAVLNEEGPGYHWEMMECKLTRDEYVKYLQQLESPALDLLSQMLNDMEANQAMAEITTDEYHEEQMQMLNDISADIALLGDEAEEE